MTADYMRSMLTELFKPYAATSKSFSDDDVCKHHLVAYCPHGLFYNTKADIGTCSNLHDDALRRAYQDTSDKSPYRDYERRFYTYLQKLVDDLDARIRAGRRRLALVPVANLTQAEIEAKNEKTLMIEHRIKELLVEAEKAGESGQVDLATHLTQQVDVSRSELRALVNNEDANPTMRQEKQLEVCDTCGAFVAANDTVDRVQAHLTGKQHTGYLKVRETLGQYKAKQRQQGEANAKEDAATRASFSPRQEHGRRPARSRSRSPPRRRRYSRSRSPRDRRYPRSDHRQRFDGPSSRESERHSTSERPARYDGHPPPPPPPPAPVSYAHGPPPPHPHQIHPQFAPPPPPPPPPTGADHDTYMMREGMLPVPPPPPPPPPADYPSASSHFDADSSLRNQQSPVYSAAAGHSHVASGPPQHSRSGYERQDDHRAHAYDRDQRRVSDNPHGRFARYDERHSGSHPRRDHHRRFVKTDYDRPPQDAWTQDEVQVEMDPFEAELRRFSNGPAAESRKFG